MNWYTKNSHKAVEANNQAMIKEREERKIIPFRLFLKANEQDRKLIYLDDEGFSFWEHNINIPGRGWTQLTCLRPNPGCPMCQMQDKPYFVTLFSVIDTNQYTDRNGQVKKNQKKIHALKTEAAGKLFKLKETCKGLRGKAVVASRGGPTEAASGSMFMVERDANDKQVVYNLVGEQYKEFDYAELFKPKPVEELRTILGMPTESNSNYGSPSNDLSVSHADAGPIELEQAPTESNTDLPSTANENDVPF